MTDKPLPKIVGKKRKEPDLQLIASALIDLVLREQEQTEVASPESEAA